MISEAICRRNFMEIWRTYKRVIFKILQLFRNVNMFLSKNIRQVYMYLEEKCVVIDFKLAMWPVHRQYKQRL